MRETRTQQRLANADLLWQSLANDRTIESCKITEKDFLVLMVKKPVEKKAPAVAVPEKVEQKPAEVLEQPKQEEAKPTEVQTPKSDEYNDHASKLVTGDEFNATVTRIMEMGFSREQVLQALEAAYNNPDRAVDFLMMALDGVPVPQIRRQAQSPQPQTQHVSRPQAQPQVAQVQPQGGEGSGVFDFLKNTPQFQQLRLLARQNPAMLEQVLSQLPRNVVQVITENQEEFIRLLQEEPVLPGGIGGLGPNTGSGPVSAPDVLPSSVQVQVTSEDQAIINNLVDMGFERNKVMQVYFLFEKDAEMTANYLLNHGLDGGDDDGFGFGQ